MCYEIAITGTAFERNQSGGMVLLGPSPVSKSAWTTKSRREQRNSDLEYQGERFWIGSAGIQVRNNVASDMDGNGFAVWTLGLVEIDRNEDAGFRTDTITRETNTYRAFTHGGVHKGRALRYYWLRDSYSFQ